MQQPSFLLPGFPCQDIYRERLRIWSAVTGVPELVSSFRSTLQHQNRCVDVMPPTLDIDSALLLVDSGETVIARRALLTSGIRRVKAVCSGEDAARLLADTPDGDPLPDVVVVHPKLADMSGEEFAGLLHTHPRLRQLPVLLLADPPVPVNGPGYGSNCLLLERPYSISSLQEHLYTLLRGHPLSREVSASGTPARPGIVPEDTREFETALERFTLLREESSITPQRAFTLGICYLRGRHWNAAMRMLQRAAQSPLLKGDSLLALSMVWKMKNNAEKQRLSLSGATEAFIFAEKWNKARAAYVRLHTAFPEAVSPFPGVIEKLVRERRFDAAASALGACYDLVPDRLYRTLARVCLASDQPELTLRHLQLALDKFLPASRVSALISSVDSAMRAHRENLAGHRARKKNRRPDQAALNRHSASSGPTPPLQNKNTGRTRPAAGATPEPHTSAGSTETALFLPEGSPGGILASSFPRLHEICSVIKATWLLSRKK